MKKAIFVLNPLRKFAIGKTKMLFNCVLNISSPPLVDESREVFWGIFLEDHLWRSCYNHSLSLQCVLLYQSPFCEKLMALYTKLLKAAILWLRGWDELLWIVVLVVRRLPVYRVWQGFILFHCCYITKIDSTFNNLHPKKIIVYFSTHK